MKNINLKQLSKRMVVLGVVGLTMVSCQKEQITFSALENSENNPLSTQLQDSIIPTINIQAQNDDERMLEDGESIQVMTSENRRFNISEILRIRAINKDSLEIANFAPSNITDVTITITDKNGVTTELFKADIIEAYVNKRIKNPIVLAHDSLISQIKFDYEGESKFVKKLKELKSVKWAVKPTDHDPQKDPKNNWKDYPLALDFRKAMGIMINSAYVSILPDLLTKLKADTIVKNDKVTIMTDTEKEQVILNFQNHGQFNVGVIDFVNYVNGLGGGHTIGFTTSGYSKYYKQTFVDETLGHEFGHCLGYNHSSNMTYSQTYNGRKHGFGQIFGKVWLNLILTNELPITQHTYFRPQELTW